MDDDFELLRAWRDGDRRAGQALFERHFSAVRRFFRNKAPANEIEDLVQRTFVVALEHQQQFRGDARFVVYLLAIARSQLHRWLRKRDPVRDGIDGETVSLFDLGVSPSHVVAAHERARVILDALQRLPIDTQTLLELHYWEGLDAAEIGIAIGATPGAVRTRLTRARQALRELVAGEVADDQAFDAEARTLSRLLE